MVRWVFLQIPMNRHPTPQWCLLVTVNIFYDWLIGSGATFKTIIVMHALL